MEPINLYAKTYEDELRLLAFWQKASARRLYLIVKVDATNQAKQLDDTKDTNHEQKEDNKT